MISKICLGFSIAMLALSATVELKVLTPINLGLQKVLLINLIMGASGFLALFLGLFQKARPKSKNPENLTVGEFDADQHPLAFFGSLKYWGTILIILAIIPSVVPVYKLIQPKVSATVRSAMPPQTPVKFPPMRIQGIVLRESKSSVMINGKIYFIGDEISGARVVSIDWESVTLELAGQTNVLTLRK